MYPARIATSAGRTFLFAGFALALAFGLFAGPRSASAHAEVKSSSPAAGASVEAGITSISINFTEDVSVDSSTARLEGPGGAVAGTTAAVDRANRVNMIISTPPLSAGTYTVHWTAVTEDDNATENGSFNFTVAAASSTPSSPSGSSATTSAGSGTPLPATGAGSIDLALSLFGGTALVLLGLGFAVRIRVRAR
jgi:methionine-rich copper-binding protein CopC